MTAFRDRSWDQRLRALGDEAESQFAVFAEGYPFGFAPYGLARPPIQVHKVPLKIRYTPDFITTKYLYEVQGHGRDRVVKIKDDKLEALEAWNDDMPVRLFLWCSTTRTRWDVPFDNFYDLIVDGPQRHEGWFDETKRWVGQHDSVFEAFVV